MIKQKYSLYFTMFLIVFMCNLIAYSQSPAYSFICAGHAYGAHSGDNIGLHPPFLESLNNGFDTTVQFFVFTGDIINHSNEESWQKFEQEISSYDLPYYCAMGNHDNNELAHSFYQQHFGNDYYAFDFKSDRFIILNSTEKDRAISENQMEFLEAQLSLEAEVNNVFIFFHEVIWNSHVKYKDTRSNSRSRYDKVKDISNYWTEVHPLLEQHNDKNIVLISGDVAGNSDAVPAFYDRWGNVTLMSSGMGEVEDENYLQVNVMNNGAVEYKLVALRATDEIKNIEWYSIPESPDEIVGESSISNTNELFTYTTSTVYNADSYLWELTDGILGTSSSSSIQIEYLPNFNEGNIQVASVHDGFGVSDFVNLKIERLMGINDYNDQLSIYSVGQKIIINSAITQQANIKIYDLNGLLIYNENALLESTQAKEIPFKTNNSKVYVCAVSNFYGIGYTQLIYLPE